LGQSERQRRAEQGGGGFRRWLGGLAWRLSYANVTATLALFIALGGTSYGLVITGGQIKDHSITGRDIRDHSLGGRQLKRSSIGAYAIKESRLGKVPQARRADTVGGLSAGRLRLHCPGGTRAVGDGCVELAARAPEPYSNEGPVRECGAAATEPPAAGWADRPRRRAAGARGRAHLRRLPLGRRPRPAQRALRAR
jgi:hypothetical protein